MKGFCDQCGNYTEHGHATTHPWLVDEKDQKIICDNCFQKIGE